MLPATKLPLSESLRPKTFAEMALSHNVRQRLQAMVDNDNIMNMVFYGCPGTGKTTAAQILVGGKPNLSTLFANGTEASGVDFVRNTILRFVATASLNLAGCKFCVIDEADQLSDTAQKALRGVIEGAYGNCRFIFTANDLTKIHLAVQSRLLPLSFHLPSEEQEQALEDYTNRLLAQLRQNQVRYDEPYVRKLALSRFPDFRAIANLVEFECGGVP